MKNKLSLLLTFVFSLFFLSTTLYPIHGLTITTEFIDVNVTGEVVTSSHSGQLLIYNPGDHLSKLYVGQELVFCIEPGIAIGDGTGYTQSDFTSSQQELFNRIIYHGWEKSLKTNEDYVITQFALWRNSELGTVTGLDNLNIVNYHQRHQELMDKVNQHEVLPSFANNTYHVEPNVLFSVTDAHQIVTSNQLMSNNGTVENFTLSLSPTISPLILQFKKFTDITSNTSIAPLLYSHPIHQDVIHRGSPNPMLYSINIEPILVGSLELTKVNTNKEVIPGAEFLISNGEFSQKYTTNAQGQIIINDLDVGVYTIEELNVGAPFLISKEVKTIEIKPTENLKIEIVNEQAQGQLQIQKHDGETKTPLMDSKFEIRDQQNSVIASVTTNQDGIATSPLIPLGTYTIKEISAPKGYVLDETIHSVSVDYQDQYTPVVLKTLQIENESAKGQIEITKVDSENENKPLPGAQFEVRDAQTNQVVASLVSDETGVARTTLLPLGKYTIKEIKAPNGYLLNSKVYPVELVYQDSMTPVVVQQMKLTNDPIKGKIMIVKMDSKDNEIPIPNAVFELREKETNQLIQTLTTDKKGIALSQELRVGDYVLKEVEAPQEYYVNENEFTFTISRHKEILVQEITNDEILIKLQIHKLNTFNESLSGAHFEIRNKDNEVVNSTDLISNEEGLVITQEALKAGVYSLHEIKAPSGYRLAEPIIFEINRETSVIELETIGRIKNHTVVNEQTITEIKKVDQNGNPLEGARLSLINQQGEIIDSWVSTVDSHSIKGLVVNKEYTLVEEEAPEGYFLAEPITFVAQEENQIQMVNEMIPLIHTLASFNNELKETLFKEDLVVVDDVSLQHLWVDQEYTLKGQLINTENGEVISQNQLIFTADQQYLTKQLEFQFKPETAGLSVVVFEQLYRDDKLVAIHEDMYNSDQRVTIPSLMTFAHASTEKEVLPLENMVITDEVQFTHLHPKDSYTLIGEIKLKSSGQIVSTQHLVFSPQSQNGSVQLDFTFDASKYPGETVVVFESLYKDENLIATHHDIDSPQQSVTILNPSLKTKASTLNREMNHPDIVHIVDEVHLNDLLIDKTYTLKGWIVSKDTQQIVSEIKEMEFISTDKQMKLDLKFQLDQELLNGESLVVFEELYYEGKLIASHNDLTDENQTINIMKVNIEKVDSLNNSIKLENAHFELRQGEVVLKKLITNEFGKAEFYVEQGQFTLIETQAPEGYFLDSHEIEVQDETVMVITNTKKIELPKTGQKLENIGFGGILSIGFGVLLLKQRKRAR